MFQSHPEVINKMVANNRHENDFFIFGLGLIALVSYVLGPIWTNCNTLISFTPDFCIKNSRLSRSKQNMMAA